MKGISWLSPAVKKLLVNHEKRNGLSSIAILITLGFSLSLSAQQPGNSLTEFINEAGGHSQMIDSVLRYPESYRLQIILTKINRSNSRQVSFDTYDFNTGSYFYPASLVKLPVAIFTLVKLDSLRIPLSAVLKMDKDINCGSTTFVEKSLNNELTFSRIIEDMMTVSDNDSYNLLYHFLTPGLIKQKLLEENFPSTNIFRNFSGCDISENLRCNSCTVFVKCRPIYHQGVTCMDSAVMMKYYTYSKDRLVGNSVLENGVLTEGPKDFNYHLEYPLNEVHETLKRLIFPGSYSKAERWSLSNKNRKYLIRCMGIYPSEMENSLYRDHSKFPANYNKYLIFGDTIPAENSNDIRTIGKIGISYGFVTESAYIVDFRHHCDFFLSVSMYVNSDGIINDGKYEYDEIARPFFAQLSRILLEQIVQENEVKKAKKAWGHFRKFQRLFD